MPNNNKKMKSKSAETPFLPGRYPIWDKIGMMDV